MDIRKILIAMREILSPDGAWTQGACGRDKLGNPSVRVSAAASRCIAGASLLAASHDYCVSGRVLNFLSQRSPAKPNSIVTWQDTEGRTQAEVLALLDKCIAELDRKAKAFKAWHEVEAELWEIENSPARELEDA